MKKCPSPLEALKFLAQHGIYPGQGWELVIAREYEATCSYYYIYPRALVYLNFDKESVGYPRIAYYVLYETPDGELVCEIKRDDWSKTLFLQGRRKCMEHLQIVGLLPID